MKFEDLKEGKEVFIKMKVLEVHDDCEVELMTVHDSSKSEGNADT